MGVDLVVKLSVAVFDGLSSPPGMACPAAALWEDVCVVRPIKDQVPFHTDLSSKGRFLEHSFYWN